MSGRDDGGVVLRYWVLIETGGNQSFIFDTNRLRHAVGASQLIHESTTVWLKQVAGDHEDASVVQAVSGKALLLVDSPATGRAIIRAVSRRVLQDAPGLALTGAVGPPLDDTTPAVVAAGESSPSEVPPGSSEQARDFLEGLGRARRELDAARSARPSMALRDLVMPWHELCPESGLPVAGAEIYGRTARPAAEPVLSRSRSRDRARKRMLTLLGEQMGELVPENMDELAHDGWIAVVHADGNGVGTLFQSFPSLLARALQQDELSLQDFCDYLDAVSGELEEATCGAFAAAVATAATAMHEPRDTVLPLVIGGDDVTFARPVPVHRAMPALAGSTGMMCGISKRPRRWWAGCRRATRTTCAPHRTLAGPLTRRWCGRSPNGNGSAQPNGSCSASPLSPAGRAAVSCG